MTNAMKTIEVRVERTYLLPPGEVFDAWLNPKIPGTPWNMGDKMLLNPTSRWVVLLERQRNAPLRAIYGDGATGAEFSTLGVAEHVGRGIDGDCDLSRSREKRP